jgi:hypothetical protein
MVMVAVAPSRCTIIRAVAARSATVFLSHIGGICPHYKIDSNMGGGGSVLDIFSSVGGRMILLVRVAVVPPLQAEK